MSICGGGDFISAIQKEVFVCGKSLHLLRLCQPSHHLCAAVVDHQPGIKLLVTPVEVSA